MEMRSSFGGSRLAAITALLCAVGLVGARLTQALDDPAAAAASSPPPTWGSGEPPEGSVLADLPMFAAADSPGVHIDIAAPGDSPLPVVIDTGSFHSVAGSLGLQRFGGQRHPTGREVYQRATVLGRPLNVARLPDATREANADPFVHLGLSFLQQFVVEIDFAKERVRFLDPERVTLPEEASAQDEVVYPLQGATRPTVLLKLNEHAIPLHLDTTVPVPAWIRTRDLVRASISPQTLPILRPRGDGDSTVRVFETDLFRFGTIDLGVFPVIVTQAPHRDAFGVNEHVIGIDLLSRFRVRLDLARRRVWLQHQGGGPVRFGGLAYSLTRRSGAYVVPFGNALDVFGVLPGSPAEAMGLLPGDRIDLEEIGLGTRSQLLDAIAKQAPLLVDRPTGPRSRARILLPEPTAPAATTPGSSELGG